MELDKKTMGLISETLAKNKKESYRNAVQITNTEIIENLGQIDLCVCDKTGTLTNNSLKFRIFYTDGKLFYIKDDFDLDGETSQGN